MALSNKERQRRYYERQKERLKSAPDPMDQIARRPFNEYLTANEWAEVLTYLEWAGINPVCVGDFEADEDPQHNPETDGPFRGSIGRAERMVGCLLDAASQLATLINDYKSRRLAGL